MGVTAVFNGEGKELKSDQKKYRIDKVANRKIERRATADGAERHTTLVVKGGMGKMAGTTGNYVVLPFF